MFDKLKKFFSREIKIQEILKREKEIERPSALEMGRAVAEYVHSKSGRQQVEDENMNKVLADIAFKSKEEQKYLLKEIQSSNLTKEDLQKRINEERDSARKYTEQGDSKRAAVQWDIVEELSAEAADQSAYAKFCEENPSDHNCKMYDV